MLVCKYLKYVSIFINVFSLSFLYLGMVIRFFFGLLRLQRTRLNLHVAQECATLHLVCILIERVRFPISWILISVASILQEWEVRFHIISPTFRNVFLFFFWDNSLKFLVFWQTFSSQDKGTHEDKYMVSFVSPMLRMQVSYLKL